MQPTEDPQGHYSRRSSHSGPLVNRSQWTKARKIGDGTPKITATENSTSLSSSVAARGDLLSNNGCEKTAGQSQVVAPSRPLSESGNNPSDNSRKYDQLFHMHVSAGSQQREDDRSSNMDQHTVSSW